MVESRTVIVPSSFVRRELKLLTDSGSGEAKLFIGSTKITEELDNFFNNYQEDNVYYFSRSNLLEYLQYSKLEFVAQLINKYKSVGLEYHDQKYSEISNIEEKTYFTLSKFVDSSRYYLKCEGSEVFTTCLRSVALPKITNLVISKESDKEFSFKLELNFQEILKLTQQSVNEKAETSLIIHPHQRIFFGAPGTGKSYELNAEANECFAPTNFERVTFHPNYMYGNFVGSYKPFPKKIKDAQDKETEIISYEFVPGILVRLLVKALQNPTENFLLIIEEINRAPVAAVFGDIFQLLDRNSHGESEYFISASRELQEYLRTTLANANLTDEIRSKLGSDFSRLFLPKNLYLWATMNSADQGVLPLDTAFRRRWSFKYIGVDDAADKNAEDFLKYRFRISAEDNELVTWDIFRRELNKRLSALNIPEDKLLGPYFISKPILDKCTPDELTEVIKDKVLMYLYEDVARANRSLLFAEGKFGTYSSLCKHFIQDALGVFKGRLDIPADHIILESVAASEFYAPARIGNWL